jgi:vacuolar iron transporter family protein
MMDGTVSIFGLIFGVAATTSSSATVLIAGASGAAAAAVSMMAGAYLDVETNRDEVKANHARFQADFTGNAGTVGAILADRLAAAGVPQGPANALSSAVRRDPDAIKGLLLAVLRKLRNSTHGSKHCGCCSPILSPRRSRSFPLLCSRYHKPGRFARA